MTLRHSVPSDLEIGSGGAGFPAPSSLSPTFPFISVQFPLVAGCLGGRWVVVVVVVVVVVGEVGHWSVMTAAVSGALRLPLGSADYLRLRKMQRVRSRRTRRVCIFQGVVIGVRP